MPDLVASLRACGLRVTAPRRAIASSIAELGSHFTAEQLGEHVQRSHPDVHLATIYRTLDTLTRIGAVSHVHLGHGPSVFHLPGEGHQHLVCDACGDVVEVPEELFADLARRVSADHDFELHPGHFALGGRCGRCRAASAGSKP
jgi:Fe2+ or Zn2+ uptake regulation protein